MKAAIVELPNNGTVKSMAVRIEGVDYPLRRLTKGMMDYLHGRNIPGACSPRGVPMFFNDEEWVDLFPSPDKGYEYVTEYED